MQPYRPTNHTVSLSFTDEEARAILAANGYVAFRLSSTPMDLPEGPAGVQYPTRTPTCVAPDGQVWPVGAALNRVMRSFLVQQMTGQKNGNK